MGDFMHDETFQEFLNVLVHLKWSIQALAQSAAIQHTLFPDFVCVPDELALEFDEYYRQVLNSPLSLKFDLEQLSLVRELDQKLASISGPENERFWCDKALESAPEWNEVRMIAKSTLKKFGWPEAPPPVERAIYVGPTEHA